MEMEMTQISIENPSGLHVIILGGGGHVVA
jgi:hypothetical protein